MQKHRQPLKTIQVDNQIKEETQPQPAQSKPTSLKGISTVSNNQENPQESFSFYKERIYEYLKEHQKKFLPNKNYMKERQVDISKRMRTMLLDWLVNVHDKFKLIPEVLFLTMNIIDRFLSKVCIQRDKL